MPSKAPAINNGKNLIAVAVAVAVVTVTTPSRTPKIAKVI